MSYAPKWGALPFELRQRAQWCVAGPDKAPLAVGANGLYHASVTNPATWMGFDEAAAAAYPQGLHIGYVLSHDDPYCCIDLDVCDAESQARKGQPHDPSKWTTALEFDRYWSMVQSFDSYTERSTYGKGLHIWVRGSVPKGAKRGGVELYPKERFIISTGDVIVAKAIADRQDMVANMFLQMQVSTSTKLDELVEVEEVDSDQEIIERAIAADNADKFNNLCNGQWQEYGFPSQSEADLALMSMFTFYSPSNEQCKRLFRMTQLGKREKAVKNDRYVNDTLRVIRHRQANEAAAVAHGMEGASAIIAAANARAAEQAARGLHITTAVDPVPVTPPASAGVAMSAPMSAQVASAPESGLPWPPAGLINEMARFVYRSAPRPVKEVAIVTALGIMAGIAGKAWCIPQSGLNMYLILIARSGVGKEAMHSGTSALLHAAMKRSPAMMQFANFGDFASGPALVKACAEQPSFINIAGEWGRKLKKMAQDERDGAMATLRTIMTNLYQKSGPQSIMGGINYSDKEKNVAQTTGVAYSMMGESTPDTFYQALTESMMEDGFLSRFLTIEYDGQRPPLNPQQELTPSQALSDALAEIGTLALQQIGRNVSPVVDKTNDAAGILATFERECDEKINSSQDESWRQMWNRASLKVMRVSALLAIAKNWYFPIIEVEHVEWALMVVRRDISLMRRRIETGDVGMNDASREKKLMSIMFDYVTNGASDGYRIPPAMRGQGIVPRKYLQIRAQRCTSFNTFRNGSSAALVEVLKGMLENGYIQECQKSELVQFGAHGKCYRIVNLPDSVVNAQ